MPYQNVPDNQQAAMKDCIAQVTAAHGYPTERAAAICYASIVGGVNLATAISASADAVAQVQESYRERHYSENALHPVGRVWAVTIIGGDVVTVNGVEYVKSLNGRLYATAGLRAAPPLFNGVEVCDNHLTDAEFQERAGMRSFKNEVVGFLDAVTWDASAGALVGQLKIVDALTRDKLSEAHALGVLKNMGLSVDVDGKPGADVEFAGRRYKTVDSIEAVYSVDVVLHPAAGGRFERVIENGGIQMMDEERVKELIAEALAGQPLADAVTDEGVAPVDAAAAVVDAVEQAIEDGGDAEDVIAAAVETADEIAGAVDEVGLAGTGPEELQERVRKLECAQLLERKLGAARLGTPERAIVEAAFAGRVFTEAELNAVIKRAKEAQALHDASGKAQRAGASSAGRVILSDADKRELDLLRLVMGKRQFETLADSEKSYVQDAKPSSYRAWERAGKPNLGDGHYGTRDWMRSLFGFTPRLDTRTMEAMTRTTLSSAVKNTVNILLANDYARQDEWWEPLVQEHEVDTIDDMTLVRAFGLNALAVVAEGAAYTEFAFADEEETAAFVKNGNYLGITLEALLSDKIAISEMQSISRRLSASWFNTLSDYVAGVFTVNTAAGPTLSDTGALFNATVLTTPGGHANLLTTALSYTAWDAVVTAMMLQRDQPLGVGRRLALDNAPKYLLVPVNLRTTALRIRNSELIPGAANNDINPHYQGFEVVVVPSWTDTNDWAAMADPAINPAIHLIFPTGNRVPAIFDSTDESQGALFTNDTLRYKVRLMTYRFSAAFACAPVSDFRPLHKSNV